LLLVVLVTTEERLRMVFVLICVSLAFEGAKQGWAQLVLNPGGVNSNPHRSSVTTTASPSGC
jgi:hypothetical protein